MNNSEKMYYKIIIINRQTENIFKNINVRKKRTEIRSEYSYKERKEDRMAAIFLFPLLISQLSESQK